MGVLFARRAVEGFFIDKTIEPNFSFGIKDHLAL
jgi:hypothetical protein